MEYYAWQNIKGVKFQQMYAHWAFGSNKLANHLCSTFQKQIWLGKILAKWLPFAKFTNILSLLYSAMCGTQMYIFVIYIRKYI